MEFMLQTGESREGQMTTNKCYAFYVAPNNKEMNLKNCASISKLYNKCTMREKVNGSTEYTSTYSTEVSVILSVLFLSSSFGKARKKAKLFVKLGEEYPLVRIDGAFGIFEGHADVLNKDDLSIAIDEGVVAYRELATAKVIKKGVTKRSLFIRKDG